MEIQRATIEEYKETIQKEFIDKCINLNQLLELAIGKGIKSNYDGKVKDDPIFFYSTIADNYRYCAENSTQGSDQRKGFEKNVEDTYAAAFKMMEDNQLEKLHVKYFDMKVNQCVYRASVKR